VDFPSPKYRRGRRAVRHKRAGWGGSALAARWTSGRAKKMNDWLHNLALVWMALLVFGLTYVVAAAIYAFINVLAVGERARSFKAVSAGLLSPLGIIFALFVAFTAS
jgi:hypothetical protein